jgi:hypothetical protein
VKTLAKTKLKKEVPIKGLAVTWRETRGGRSRTLCTLPVTDEYKFNSLAIVQLDGEEATELGLKTALGVIMGTETEKKQ